MKRIYLLTVFVLCASIGIAQNHKNIVYKDGNHRLNGLITNNYNQKGLPGVLILPAWKGIDSEAKVAASNLEKMGFVVFIADIYGEGNSPKDNAEAGKLASTYKSDFKAYQHRIQLALNELIKQGANPSKIAVIGYCFGGTGALEVARANMPVQGVVSIHGGLAKDVARSNNTIAPKVLVQHPAEDKSVSKADYDQLVEELREGKADWQIITYANSGHTFTNSESTDFNPTMATRAWKHLVLFLEELLK